MAEVLRDEGGRAGRNLVICCDGTNNQFGPENTNVVRLVQALDRDPLKQRVYYDPGLGTLPEPGAWGKIRARISTTAGLAFGAGIKWKVQQAYTYLLNMWQPGDRVYLFGFSRGAYTVRVLAGLLYQVGLLSRGSENMVPYALRLYKGVRDERKGGGAAKEWTKLCDNFRWTFARPMFNGDEERHFPIHFLGVWDTVSSVGWVWNPEKFPYTARNPGIRTIRHAVALDERRWFFRQNLMKKAHHQDLREVWFPGVHCDVGGGYDSVFESNPKSYSELWRLSFNWIRSEAEKEGLAVDAERLKRILASPVPSWTSSSVDPRHESLKGIWWLGEYFPKHVWNSQRERYEWRIGRGRSRVVPEKSLIHKSVVERVLTGAPTERPRNLSEEFCTGFSGPTVADEAVEYVA